MTPYRTLDLTPARPALTWWQRALCALLSPRNLAQRPWYRAHVGGRWMHGFSLPGGIGRNGWSAPRSGECPAAEFPQVILLCHCTRYTCRCEVYPYPALPTAESFETWRWRIDSILAVKDGGR